MQSPKSVLRALHRFNQRAASTQIARSASLFVSIGSILIFAGCAADTDDTSAESGGDGDGDMTGGAAWPGDSDQVDIGDGDGWFAGDGDGDISFGSGTGGSSGSAEPPGGSNIAFGGSQDIGYFRSLLDAGTVPQATDFDAAGFFAEHHTELVPPSCGERVCLEPMVGVMDNLMNGNNCSMIQLALTSPIEADLDNRPPLDLAVVVDTSGSMQSDNKIDFVRDGLEMLIDGMKDGDRFSLITYSNDAQVEVPMIEVLGNRAQMRDAVEALGASGGTNLYEGLELGYNEILDGYDSSRQNRVILLSDGQPTSGITNSTTINTMSRGYNSDGIGLTTVGLGTDFNVELMRDLALQADGNFYFLENSAAVEEVFTEELSYFTVPIAFDLELSVEAGDYYRFGEAHGSPFWQNTSSGGNLSVPSVFVAHRESDTDVTDGGGRRGGGSALLLEFMPTVFADDGSGASNALIATVDVQFREPGSNEIISDTVQVNYPRPPWMTEDAGYWDGPSTATVQKSFVMLNAFVGMRNAVSAFHEDPFNSSGAVSELRALVQAMEDYNEEIQDVDIDYDIALIEQLIDVMIERGTPDPEPVVIDDPWPAD